MWMAPDALWIEYHGGKNGISCLECFVDWLGSVKGAVTCFFMRQLHYPDPPEVRIEDVVYEWQLP